MNFLQVKKHFQLCLAPLETRLLRDFSIMTLASGATAEDGTLIICGGYITDYKTNVKEYSSECFKLNSNQDPNWTKLGDMSIPRSVCLFVLSPPKSLLKT